MEEPVPVAEPLSERGDEVEEAVEVGNPPADCVGAALLMPVPLPVAVDDGDKERSVVVAEAVGELVGRLEVVPAPEGVDVPVLQPDDVDDPVQEPEDVET